MKGIIPGLVGIVCLAITSAASFNGEYSAAFEIMRPDEFIVTYISNEGFLISLDGKKVLIDGLFGPPANNAPAGVMEKVETGQAPFDNLALILVTHNHHDHFRPESVLRALINNPDAVLLSTPQVFSDLQLHQDALNQVRSRVHTIDLEPDHEGEVSFNDLQILVMSTGHDGMPEVQNYMYLVSNGSDEFFHEGDACLSQELLSQYRLGQDSLDIAFFHYGYLVSPEWLNIIDRTIPAKDLIPMHVSAGQRRDADRALALLIQTRPDIHYLRECMDHISLRY